MTGLRLIYSTIILLIINTGLYTQTDSSQKTIKVKKWSYETGMNLYSLDIRGGDYYSGYKKIIDNYALSGLYAKFYKGKTGIRTSIDYLQKIIIDRTNTFPRGKTISSRGLQIGIGYQRLFGKRKLSPYFFTDLSLNYMKELRQRPDNSNYLEFNVYYNDFMTNRTASLSAIPGLGLRIQMKKNLVINIESGAQFFYSLETSSDQGGRNKMIGITSKAFKCSLGYTF